MSKKVILMIHGMWCGNWAWKNFKIFFESQGFICVSPNLRHHQESQKFPCSKLGTTSLSDYAQDLEEIIKKLEKQYGELPIIMGHSMGGLLAQMLASQDLAKALVLLAPAAPRHIFALRPSVLWIFIKMLSDPQSQPFWKKPLKIGFEEACWGLFNKIQPKNQKELYANLCYESGLVILQTGLWIADKEKATSVNFKKVKCPIIILTGDKDRITPIGISRIISQKYKYSNPVFEKLHGHAHWLLAEPGWEEIAQKILLWVKNLT